MVAKQARDGAPGAAKREENAEMNMKKMLTPKDVAAWLSIPLSTVYDYLHDGTLPGMIKIGRLVRVDAAKLEQWLNEQAHKKQEKTP